MASVSWRLSVTEYCKQRLRFGEKDDTNRSERVGDVFLVSHVGRCAVPLNVACVPLIKMARSCNALGTCWG